jgi:hypothetical protein
MAFQWQVQQNPRSPTIPSVLTWVCLKMGYTPNYSHLVGIMISKTIGCRGTQHFQTNPLCPSDCFGMPFVGGVTWCYHLQLVPQNYVDFNMAKKFLRCPSICFHMDKPMMINDGWIPIGWMTIHEGYHFGIFFPTINIPLSLVKFPAITQLSHN